MMVGPSTAVARTSRTRRRGVKRVRVYQISHVAPAAQERNQVMRSQNEIENSRTTKAPAAATSFTRRSVLKGLTAAMGAAATFAALGTNFAWAQVSEEIKVGLIGCGGRGKGAGGNIAQAAAITKQGVKIHAMGDAFAKDTDKPTQDFISRHK